MSAGNSKDDGTPVLAKRSGEVAVAVAIVTFSLALWAGTLGFPEGAGNVVGAAFWPRMVAAILAVLGIILLVESLLGRTIDVDADPINKAQWLPMTLVLFIIFFYVLVWPVVGFLPATLVGLVLLSKVLGIAEWWRAVFWSVILTAVVWGLFAQLLKVPL